jgi:hypothetical protein
MKFVLNQYLANSDNFFKLWKLLMFFKRVYDQRGAANVKKCPKMVLRVMERMTKLVQKLVLSQKSVKSEEKKSERERRRMVKRVAMEKLLSGSMGHISMHIKMHE